MRYALFARSDGRVVVAVGAQAVSGLTRAVDRRFSATWQVPLARGRPSRHLAKKVRIMDDSPNRTVDSSPSCAFVTPVLHLIPRLWRVTPTYKPKLSKISKTAIGTVLGAAVSRFAPLRAAIGSLITGLQTMPSIMSFPDSAWLQVDLGSVQSFNHVQLAWEAAYAKGYRIQTSNDGNSWSTVYSTTGGNGGLDDLNISGSGRYVRMTGTVRATAYGYSLFEFGIYRQ
jgi:hypothetical protein